jgi:hypothetical protein
MFMAADTYMMPLLLYPCILQEILNGTTFTMDDLPGALVDKVV